MLKLKKKVVVYGQLYFVLPRAKEYSKKGSCLGLVFLVNIYNFEINKSFYGYEDAFSEI